MLHLLYFIITSTKLLQKPQTGWMKTYHKKIEDLKRTQNKISNIRDQPTENIIFTTFHHMFYRKKKSVLYHLALKRTFQRN